MKILVLSASTGGGHMRASAALKAYITQHDKNAVVKIVDTLEYVSPILNKTVSEGYVFLATKTPKLYGSVYNTANRDTPLNSVVTKVTGQLTKKLYPLILDFTPDVIVTVHAFAAEMASNLKKDYHVKAPLICIITDFAPHKTYINEKVDSYIVSSEEMVDAVEAFGVPREKIHSLGIPIDPSFYEKYDRVELMRQMRLDPQKPTILIMAGSFGVTDILKIYQNIAEIDLDFQIIVITGKNPKLYDAFEKLLNKSAEEEAYIKRQKSKDAKTPSEADVLAEPGTKSRRVSELSTQLKEKTGHLKEKLRETKAEIKEDLLESALIQKLYRGSGKAKPTKLLYFVSDVNKYMSIADLIITKPGGLTVSESLASSLPMAIFKAFPGQEEENADFLLRHNMAIRLPKGRECRAAVEDLLLHPEKLESMKTACRAFFKEQSAGNIYKLIQQLTQQDRR